MQYAQQNGFNRINIVKDVLLKFKKCTLLPLLVLATICDIIFSII